MTCRTTLFQMLSGRCSRKPGTAGRNGFALGNTPPPQKPGMRPSAFTLVEVLLAVAILAFGLTGVLAAYAKSADTLRIAEEHLNCYTLLKERMSELMEQARFGKGLPEGEVAADLEGAWTGYAWQLQVKPGPDKNLQEVTLTMSSQKSERTYTLATYVRFEEDEAQ